MTTWEQLCEVEPRLRHVEELAATLGIDEHYRHYEAVKHAVRDLQGDNPELCSCEAWDVAIHHLSQLVCP